MKKLNAYELMAASTMWCLDIDDLTVTDYRAFLEHMHFIAVRAMNDDFKDAAHVAYDTSVRKLAEAHGFAAFAASGNGASVIHYGAQNMRQKKSVGSTAGRKQTGHTQGGKRSCFLWNKEAGCSKSEDQCGYGHWCTKCGSKSHAKHKCSRD